MKKTNLIVETSASFKIFKVLRISLTSEEMKIANLEITPDWIPGCHFSVHSQKDIGESGERRGKGTTRGGKVRRGRREERGERGRTFLS